MELILWRIHRAGTEDAGAERKIGIPPKGLLLQTAVIAVRHLIKRGMSCTPELYRKF